MNKKIAIAIFNMIQFYALEPGIIELKKRNYDVDIYIPDFLPDDMDESAGYLDIYCKTYEEVNKMGYKVKRKYKNEKYKIVLSPYYVKNFYDFKCDYNLKYIYGISAKPNITMKLRDNVYFDGIICFSEWEKQIFSTFALTHNIGYLKYYNFKKEKKKVNEKKTLLYLPTYGDTGSLENARVFLKLKKKYKLQIKIHHNSSYLKSESSKLNNLENVFDEIYDQNTKLIDLMAKADFIISDNSGSIFDAIRAEVPIAIFSKKMDLSIGNLKPLQDVLVEQGVILSTDNPNDLDKIINKTLEEGYLKKQQAIKKKLFPYDNSELVDNFIRVIDSYLNNEVSQTYYDFHTYIKEEIITTLNNETKFYKELVDANNYIKQQMKTIEQYESKKLINILRKIKNKIKSMVK